MRKIVNGRLYDTNEAIVACSWCETATVFGIEVEVNFLLCREKVAEKPMEGLKLATWGGVSDYDVKKDESKGDFFLATQVGGSYGPCRIRPLDVDEARRVYEEHTDSDYSLENEYQRYFGVRPRKSEAAKEPLPGDDGRAAKRNYSKEEAKKRRKAYKRRKAAKAARRRNRR